VQIALVAVLLTTPGVILLRVLRVPQGAVERFPIYVVCGSIVVLFASGLAVDVIGPILSVSRPLRPMPLLVGFEAINFALICLSLGSAQPLRIPWRSIVGPAKLKWPLVVSFLAAIGALELNSGHSAAVAILALSICIALLVGTALVSRRLDDRLLATILYAVELALLWGFSLRGDGVYGFDISREYYDLSATVSAGIWHTAHPGDAYGALLSVTIMPTELHFLSGVPALLIFKVVYPIVTALIPVGIYSLARTIMTKTWAFIAAALFVAQLPFAEELPQLARQEIALILFLALLAVILDSEMRRWPRWTLAALLSIAVVLSHYSTTYIAITLLAVLVGLRWIVSWRRRIPKLSGTVVIALGTSVIAALVWYWPLTHSQISGLNGLSEALTHQGLNVLPNGQNAGSGGALSILGGYLQGNTQTPMSAQSYENRVHFSYALGRNWVTPLPAAALPRYGLQSAPSPAPPVKLASAVSAANLGAALLQQLFYLLAGIASMVMALRRRATMPVRSIGLLGVGAVVFLLLLRLSSTLAQLYNQERALMQATMIVSLSACWSLQQLSYNRIARELIVKVLVVGSVALLLVSSSSILGVALGGGTYSDLANTGEDYERFVTTTPELAAAKWLGGFVRAQQFVYADRYAQLPLIAMTGMNQDLFSDVTPFTIAGYSWVYAYQPNVVDGRARAVFDNHIVHYAFPSQYLNTNYDLVFDNGKAEVFYR
jgi:uncharacterized membrane protein